MDPAEAPAGGPEGQLAVAGGTEGRVSAAVSSRDVVGGGDGFDACEAARMLFAEGGGAVCWGDVPT